MSAFDFAHEGRAAGGFDRAFRLACFGLCVAHAVYVVTSYASGLWLVDELGRGQLTDFVYLWSAGKLVLDGTPALAYDWDIHGKVEHAAVGYVFDGYYAWLYPPPFLAIAALLALFPYSIAFAVWVAITLPIYLATVRWLVADRVGLLFAGAFPAMLSNVMVGQNGFITAALIGGTVGFMQRRPVLSGICLGLLTYKPHFGVLFPFVLIAARQWTVFATAVVVATALAVTSGLLFGWASWEAFFHSLTMSSQAYLSEGRCDWSKLQSIYGLARAVGGSETLGWSLQAIVSALTVVGLCWLWRSRASFEMKAAGLAAGTMLATPYIYLYDMPVLAIAAALLVRCALVSGWRPMEMYGLTATAVLLFAYPFVQVPVGLAATLIVMALVLDRALAPAPRASLSWGLVGRSGQ
jgi:arabinofuranan 3-O-arabinosyltransferase